MSNAKKTSKKSKNVIYNYKTDIETLGKVLASPNKKKILYSLNYPKTPKELTVVTDLNFPTISKTIKELEDLKLVEILNKNLRKGKIVNISNKGKILLKDLEERK